MFDVGFWELCLIGLISLLVIGPERLPKVARLSGFWIGKTRNMIAGVKQEINEELRAEEMRQMLKEQAGLDELQKLSRETSDTVQEIQSTLKEPLKEDLQSSSSDQDERK